MTSNPESPERAPTLDEQVKALRENIREAIAAHINSESKWAADDATAEVISVLAALAPAAESGTPAKRAARVILDRIESGVWGNISAENDGAVVLPSEKWIAEAIQIHALAAPTPASGRAEALEADQLDAYRRLVTELREEGRSDAQRGTMHTEAADAIGYLLSRLHPDPEKEG